MRPVTGPALSALGNEALRSAPTSSRRQALLADWRTAVKSEFDLTPHQRRALSAMEQTQVDHVQSGLRVAADRNGTIEIQLPDESADQRGLLRISTPGGPSELKAWFVTCHFGADCSGWDCHVGP
jgi:hypothetical protein